MSKLYTILLVAISKVTCNLKKCSSKVVIILLVNYSNRKELRIINLYKLKKGNNILLLNMKHIFDIQK